MEDQDLCCLICRENDSEFLTRCNHRYHSECLSGWFDKQKEECPLCRGPISRIQLLEDLIAKRTGSLLKACSSQPVDNKVIEWAFECQNMYILSALLKQGVVELIIPAFEANQLDFFKETLERELADSFDKTHITFLKKNLKIVDYALEVKRDFLTLSYRFDLQSVANSAAQYGHLDIVQYFSELGICSSNTTIRAIRSGHIEIVKYLTRNGTPNDQLFTNCAKFTDAAIDSGSIELLNYLMGQGLVSSDGIKMAAGKGNFEMVKFLTEQLDCSCPDDGILAAAKGGHFKILKYLLENSKKNGEITDEIIDTAAYYGHAEIVKYLVVDLDKPFSDLAFKYGYRRGNLEIVKCLMENGHPPCTSEALDFAIKNVKMDLVKYLVQKGEFCTPEAIDVLIQRRHSNSPAKSDIFDIVKVLIDAGRECSENVIFYAVQNRNYEIVKYLLEKGKSCNYKAFDEAARNGSIEIVKCLLQYDMPCSADAIDSATSEGHFEIVELLIENRKNFTFKAIEGAAGIDQLGMIKYLMKNEDLLIPRPYDPLDIKHNFVVSNIFWRCK